MMKMRNILMSGALVCSMAFAASSESFGGIGVTIVPSNAGVQIVDIIPGSPAAKAGLEANDQIVSIDGVQLSGLTIDQCREKIRGLAGSTIEVGIVRGAVKTSAVMERAALSIANISGDRVSSWYGSTTVSADELNYLAAKDAVSGTALLGVMQNGRVLESDASVNAEELQGVYMEIAGSNDKAPSVQQAVAGSSLRSFSRTSISFELKSTGSAVLRLVNSQGQTVRAMVVDQAQVGLNTYNWDGSAVANGAYTLRIEHQGSVSGYNVNLR